MTDTEKKMLELIGATEEDTKPKDQSSLSQRISDIEDVIAAIAGGEA